MSRLKKYIATKPKDEVQYVAPVPTAQELQNNEDINHSPSYRLYLRFAAMQRQHGRWVASYKKDKRMRTCFRKLAKRLEELTAQGLEIDELTYLLAHKVAYGNDLRATHLISSWSHNIYTSYVTAQRAEVVTLSDEEVQAYDEETLEYLADVRGESKEEVKKLMVSCGLM